MAVNQSQVDHILSTASADDPEVKLQNLQDEVDLLKKSVKKLLIDLRERMNEMDNPFIISSGLPPLAELPGKKAEEIPETTEEINLPEEEDEGENKETGYPGEMGSSMKTEEEILSNLQERYEEIRTNARPVPAGTMPSERPKLQKLHPRR